MKKKKQAGNELSNVLSKSLHAIKKPPPPYICVLLKCKTVVIVLVKGQIPMVVNVCHFSDICKLRVMSVGCFLRFLFHISVLQVIMGV